MKNENVPSSGPSDCMAPLTTSSLDKDSASGTSNTKSPEHQGDQNTGGITIGFKVLLCMNMSLNIDYEQVNLLMKGYGKINRIRLVLDKSRNRFDCYVVFNDEHSAKKAKEHFNGHSVNDCTLKARVFHIDNFRDDPLDFFPQNTEIPTITERILPAPKWFVAHYRNGKENMIKGAEYIRRKIGNIPDDNIKRYGKAILIKAGNETQSYLLCHFKAHEDSVIESVSPHKSFNIAKGIVYSKELYEFPDDDILRRCPGNVGSVKKLPGINHAILFTFTSPFLPDYLKISHIYFNVKKYKPRPTQCHQCLEYGHLAKYCRNDARCTVCSSIHDLTNKCTNDRFCYHCKGAHSPKWRGCPFFKYYQDILIMAENEHISFGAARHRMRKFSSNPMETFATALISNNKITTPSNAKPTEKSILTNPTEISNPPAEKSNIPSKPITSDNPRRDLNSPIKSGEEENPSVRPKTKFRFDNGFWSPPKNKRGRHSPPHAFVTKTHNQFQVLDPSGPLMNQRPQKRMALSSSCSDVGKMDIPENNMTKTKHSKSYVKSIFNKLL